MLHIPEYTLAAKKSFSQQPGPAEKKDDGGFQGVKTFGESLADR